MIVNLQYCCFFLFNNLSLWVDNLLQLIITFFKYFFLKIIFKIVQIFYFFLKMVSNLIFFCWYLSLIFWFNFFLEMISVLFLGEKSFIAPLYERWRFIIYSDPSVNKKKINGTLKDIDLWDSGIWEISE